MLQPEIWQSQIIGTLYKGIEFLTHAFNGDQYVVGGRAVHIPNANQPSNVVKNRASLPATVTKRTDIDVVYVLDEFTSDPILIPNIDTIQLSYDKRASAMAENQAKIKDVVANWIMNAWLKDIPADRIVRTTGSASASTSGGTGNRKLFRKEDVLTAKIKLDNDKMPADGRVMLITPEQLGQLLLDKDLAVNFERYADLANGIVGRLYGFAVMVSPEPPRFTNDTTPALKDPDADIAATDNVAAVAWHPFAVERALGEVKMFERTNDPQYYGDVYSFLLMMGGRRRRADNKGIVAIVEAASA